MLSGSQEAREAVGSRKYGFDVNSFPRYEILAPDSLLTRDSQKNVSVGFL